MISEQFSTAQTSILQSMKTEEIMKESILLDSPSSSTHRVTFDFEPKVKFIDLKMNKNEVKKHIKKEIDYEVRDKSIIVSKKLLKMVKKRAKKYTVIIPSEHTVTLKYKRKEDLETDLRILGFKPKTYVENRLIVHNLSFKETEETVHRYFSQFAQVDKVILEKNAKGICKGKATVTFSTAFNPISDSKLYEMRLNGRLLRVERIKKQIVNTSRLFISHMSKTLKISELRAILKESHHVPKSIKIDLENGRNKGYGFIEFGSPQEANQFIDNYEFMRSRIGKDSFVEFSQEKSLDKKKK